MHSILPWYTDLGMYWPWLDWDMVPSCGNKGYGSKFQCITGVPHRRFTSQVGLKKKPKWNQQRWSCVIPLKKTKKSTRISKTQKLVGWMTGTCNRLDDFHSHVYNVYSLKYMKPSLTFLHAFRKSLNFWSAKPKTLELLLLLLLLSFLLLLLYSENVQNPRSY
jgi:hypothetical protein